MRFVSYLSDTGPRLAGLRDEQLIDLNRTDANLPTSMVALLRQGPRAMQRARAAIERGTPLRLQEHRLLAPVPDPEKVICIGLNYADHAAESGAEIPSEPVVFNKFPSAIAAHGDPICLPAISTKVDYEAELVVVLGKRARHVEADDAMQYVAGYCCGHDVSARDWQLEKPGGQWLLGKTFDTFAPFGPALVTADEVPEPDNLNIQLRLNGETMQDSSTRQLIFSIPQLIAHLSRICTLKPGDVLFTGTPPGVGAARKPPVYLKPGDQVEVEIEGLGILENPVVAED